MEVTSKTLYITVHLLTCILTDLYGYPISTHFTFNLYISLLYIYNVFEQYVFYYMVERDFGLATVQYVIHIKVKLRKLLNKVHIRRELIFSSPSGFVL